MGAMSLGSISIDAVRERSGHRCAAAVEQVLRNLKVSQSSICRDIEELGITKSTEGIYVIDSNRTANAQIKYPVSFFCVECDEGYERLLVASIGMSLQQKE